MENELEVLFGKASGGGGAREGPSPLSFLPGSLGPQGQALARVGTMCQHQTLASTVAAIAPLHTQHRRADLWLLVPEPIPRRTPFPRGSQGQLQVGS